MLKKSLIFGTVALLLAALIALTGCTQATDGESSPTSGGWNSLYGTMDSNEVQEVIDRAVVQKEAIYLEDDLKINAYRPALVAEADNNLAATINFKSATVVLNGKVVVTGAVVINAAHATVRQGTPTGFLDLSDTGVYIDGHGQVDGSYIGNVYRVVDYVSNVSHPTETAEWIAVDTYKLGALGRVDYSVRATGIAVRSEVERVYVLDKLEIPVDGNAAGLEFIALGEVDLIGTTSIVVKTPADGKVALGNSATITSAAGEVELHLPQDVVALPSIKVESGKPFRINPSDTAKPPATLSIISVTGTDEALQIENKALTKVAVGGGTGSIIFNKLSVGDALNGLFVIRSTGKVLFNPPVTLTTGSLVAGDVQFKDKVTVDPASAPSLATSAETAAYTTDIAFKGDVYLSHSFPSTTPGSDVSRGLTITVSADGRGLTLATGKTVYLGDNTYTELKGVAVPAFPVLTVVKGAKLLADTADALLRGDLAKYTADDTSDKNVAPAKVLTLYSLATVGGSAAGDLIIKSGQLEVLTGAELSVGIARTLFVTKDIARIDSAYLSVADGGILSVGPHATTPGTVGIGNGNSATIAGPVSGTAAGTLKPTGGTVTFGYDEIAGGEGTTLKTTLAVISTGNVATTSTLRLSGVNLDLSVSGSVVIPDAGAANEENRVVLVNKGKITLDAKEGVANTGATLTSGSPAVNAKITGIGAEVVGNNANAGATLFSLTGSANGTLTITGAAQGDGDFTMAKGGVKINP